MNYVVIATILSTVSSAKTATLAECFSFDECVTDSSCSRVIPVDDGRIVRMCILTTDCNEDSKELTGKDVKKYKPFKTGCLKLIEKDTTISNWANFMPLALDGDPVLTGVDAEVTA
jgi:hypothetical protein